MSISMPKNRFPVAYHVFEGCFEGVAEQAILTAIKTNSTQKNVDLNTTVLTQEHVCPPKRTKIVPQTLASLAAKPTG